MATWKCDCGFSKEGRCKPQKCEKCGKLWRNKLAPDDDFEVFLKVAENYAKNPQ